MAKNSFVATVTFKEIFLNIMLKRIGTGSRFQFIRNVVPSTRSYIG